MERFAAMVEEEVRHGSITGASVALVDDQQTMYAAGFGLADKSKKVPAKPDTVYRAGSISKLFTALMTMQLAEQGKLDIDQPVTKYDPAFRIIAPFTDATPITLRQLMCHRSGLIRESPVGGYFDDSEPSVGETVASIESCVLVYRPNTKTKYSNIGVTVVGQAAAKVAGEQFADYQKKHLLGPIGMSRSGFLLTPETRSRLAKGYMFVADGRGGFQEIVAPHFKLGTLPAGNLYTTAEDLARFMSFLFAEGRAGEKPLLRSETLNEMFTPQLTTASNGFGLGFAVGNFRGHKTVSHSGAVYGFSSSLIALPKQKLGVIVLINDDLATGPLRKLTSAALSLMLEAKLSEKPPPKPSQVSIALSELKAFQGEYESESWWASVSPTEKGLHLNISGQRLSLTPIESLKFHANGRIAHESIVTFERDSTGLATGFTALDQKFRRVDSSANKQIPAEWKKFLGSYGPEFIPLIISVKHGHLYAMTENEFDYRLTPLNRFTFKMAPGMYTDEQIVFEAGPDGKAHSAVLANMTLKRRK